jgi:peptidyl-tRNA hydrolase, PTH1 family
VEQAIKLIIGLGNPGPEYAATRHNAGAQFVEALARHSSCSLKTEKKTFGLIAAVNAMDMNVRLFVPTTYMNESGKAVQAVLSFYKIVPPQALIVHDDIDLPVGSIRLKSDGGHGGNNGLRDIIARLNTRNFHRLRIGIGHPGMKHQVSHYVLQTPPASEQQKITQGIDHALSLLPQIVSGQWEHAMNTLHQT